MLTGLYTIIIGGAYYGIKSTIRKWKDDEIEQELESKKKECKNSEKDFLSKYTDEELENNISLKLRSMSLTEIRKMIYPKLYLHPDFNSLSSMDVLLYLHKPELYCKRILMADEGKIPEHDARWGTHSVGSRYGIIDEWSDWEINAWIINHAFMKWWDEELSKHGVPGILCYDRDIANECKRVHSFKPLEGHYLRDSSFLPIHTDYLWWDTKGLVPL